MLCLAKQPVNITESAMINSLPPGRRGCHFKCVKCEHNLGIVILNINLEITITTKVEWIPAPRLNIKKEYHVKDKMATRPSYLYNGNPYTGKTASSYWEGPRRICIMVNQHWPEVFNIGPGNGLVSLGNKSSHIQIIRRHAIVRRSDSYLNQSWLIIDWTVGNTFHRKLNQNTTIFIHEDEFANGGHLVSVWMG